jgi:NDP-sugar pyrophosphorylase family protein
MKETTILPAEEYGLRFIPPQYLPPGRDEYWLRNSQAGEETQWRHLKPEELEALVKNGNHCSSWELFMVSDPFDPSLIRNSAFHGLIRLGALRNVLLKRHDFCVPAGIRNSTVISCDIGADTVVQDCGYISHYIIGDSCILSRIDEMQTTNHAKFGNGVIKDGEDEDVRVWIDVMNEAGGRSVLPFEEMLPADAFLWAAYRDDRELSERLKAITQERYGGSRGSYGKVGSGSVIKSCRIIKDVFVGEGAYIKGANKLKNISVLSSELEPTQIGEGVEMVNGIVGYGCHAFYGAKAVRFVMGRNCNLKYGARLIHSILGDNSTVSCCEILNNLIFPVHEQHHNNSFLIASLIQGMSNMAAGATIGSNHNSRANDGEIRAGRGFWPGLSVTLKHSSRFASFVLIAKGDYPCELNISLPFSLVNNNTRLDRLELMPAYFWMYNLYALERNSWKAGARDRRKIKRQHIETGYLAPDTAEEIIGAMALLEKWMNAAGFPLETPLEAPAGFPLEIPSQGAGDDEDPEYELPAGDLLPEEETVLAEGLERRRGGAVILKPRRAYAAYRQMLRYYAVKSLAEYLVSRPSLSHADMVGEIEAREGAREWVNLGGQIVPAFRVDELRRGIREGETASWEAVHAAYDDMAAAYPLDRARQSWEIFAAINVHSNPAGGEGGGHPLKDREVFKEELEALIKTRIWISGQVYVSRAKDFHDPFRGITYRNREEMKQVAGTAEDNGFVKIIRENEKVFTESITHLIKRIC